MYIELYFIEERYRLLLLRDDNFRLHSLLQQLRPRECIIFNRRPTRESEADIYDDFFWIPHLKNILRELDIFCSCVDTSRVSKTRLYVPETDDSIIMSILSHMVCVEHDSAFLQAGDDIKTNLARRPSGCAALIRLLQRLRLFAPESVPSTHASIKITFPPETGVLLCDRSTYAALRVFGCQHKKTAASIADDPFTFGVPQSLFSILNVCRTNRGSELLRRWLQQPSTDRFTLARRHAVVREFCARPLLRDAVQRCLAGLPDIEVIAWRLQTPLGSRLSPQNYLTDMVSTLRYISRAFDAVKIVRGDVSMLCSDCNGMLTEIEKCLEDCLPLQTLLMTYIETESDANVDLWQVGVCENSAVAGESSESENCIGSPSTPLYSATDSICAPTDVYDRYTKHSICRVKPALSPELMALDAAYQNSIYQLIEEKNRMSSFMEGLTKPHDVSFGPSMCNQQDDESSPAIKRKRSNYFYINSTFLLSKKGDRRDLVHIEHNYNLGYHLRIARRGRHVLYSALEDERVRAAGIDINVISGANKKGVLFTSKQVYFYVIFLFWK